MTASLSPARTGRRASLFLFAFGLALSALPLRAGDAVSFVRVWPGWNDGNDFKRISEYFTGQENDGGRIVLRTDPKVRAGYYFLVRVSNPTPALAGATFVLRVLTAGRPDPAAFSLAAGVPHGSHVFELGLTGAGWTDKKVVPLAWRVELVGADGRTLAQQQSFLWAKPDSP